MQEKLASYGLRATANPAHQAYVAWLESQLRAIPNLELRADDYDVLRWTPTGADLKAGSALNLLAPIAVSGVVPYAKPTSPAGISGALVYLPAGTPISEENAAGKIVLRDIEYGNRRNLTLTAAMWWIYDPALTFLPELLDSGAKTGAPAPQKTDLAAAGQAGAAGVIFMHDLPREQIADWYRLYDGEHYSTPALYVGADEREQLKALAAEGGHAQITLTADVEPATTRMLVATLHGQQPDALAIESHTDGTNALWDNGPLTMLAMARYFAQFAAECRPRTLKFVFTTAHLHQSLVNGPGSGGSFALYAEEFDEDYQEGKGAAVIVIEHLGARHYEPTERSDGGPGRELRATDRTELNTFFVTESPGLQNALFDAVTRHDLRETLALRGTTPPGAHLPVQDNFGGEGNPYIRHLLPTLAFITEPWTLFTPGFSVEELIDKELLYKQSLLFADLVLNLGPMPRAMIAGAATAERATRDLLCSTRLNPSNIVYCEGTPSETGSR